VAYDNMQARKREQNVKAGRPADEGDRPTDTITEERPVVRQQPKRQSRSDRRGGAPAPSAESTETPSSTASSNGQTKSASNGQQSAAKKTAAKQTPSGAKRQPAAKSRAARQAAQKKAAQKKPGGGSPAARKTDS
jgi:YidC/Oxa1 family membrane protein insertase